MPLTTQPTRADQPSATGIGRTKSDDVDHPPTDLDVDYPAAEHEKIKQFVIDVCDEVGNHTGSGSLNSRVSTNEGAITTNTGAITALQVGATAPSNVDKSAAAAGSSTHAARVDHKHDVSTATAASQSARANAEGTATTLARSDHAHALALTIQTRSTTGALNVGTGMLFITANSLTINLPAPSSIAAFLPIFVALAGTAVFATLHRNGSEKIDGVAGDLMIAGGTGATYLLWTDGTDWYTGPMVYTDRATTPQAANAVAGSPGGSSKPAAQDHSHQVGTDTPIGFGRANTDGASGFLARADHQHDSGDGTFDDSLVTGTHSLPDADFIVVDTSGGNVTINLPTSPVLTGTCRSYSLKKKTTDTNKITVHPLGTDLVEGVNANLDLPNSTATTRPSWTLVWDDNGAAWWVF
jgi:hypothetical protein